jgi:hypothetical protein
VPKQLGISRVVLSSIELVIFQKTKLRIVSLVPLDPAYRNVAVILEQLQEIMHFVTDNQKSD